MILVCIFHYSYQNQLRHYLLPLFYRCENCFRSSLITTLWQKWNRQESNKDSLFSFQDLRLTIMLYIENRIPNTCLHFTFPNLFPTVQHHSDSSDARLKYSMFTILNLFFSIFRTLSIFVQGFFFFYYSIQTLHENLQQIPGAPFPIPLLKIKPPSFELP